jgi:hypothetical protein
MAVLGGKRVAELQRKGTCSGRWLHTRDKVAQDVDACLRVLRFTLLEEEGRVREEEGGEGREVVTACCGFGEELRAGGARQCRLL